MHCQILQTLHGESLTWASLSVGEDCDCSSVEDKIEDGVDAESVQLLIRLKLAESVVKLETLIVDKLRDTVHLEFAIVDDYSWVWNGDDVDLAWRQLLLEDWSFLNADIDFELISWDMLQKSEKG